MQLNYKQQKAIENVSSRKNTFISGPGGVGKSVVSRKIVSLFPNETVVLAPTGIAALNIGGMTIHSAFKLPFHILQAKDAYNPNKKVQQLFGNHSPVKRILIDEISMVRYDVLFTIDRILKKVRNNSRPFGGLQVIVVGDFYQLPPVVVRNEEGTYFSLYDSPYSFGGEAWAEANFNYVELNDIMRQSDQEMISNLLRIRNAGEGFEESIRYFNYNGDKNLVDVLDTDPVFLCATNKTANDINTQNYSELEGEEKVFYGEKSYGFKGQTPVEEELRLKYGAKVIITANTPDYKNGQIGYVTGFVNDRIEVLIEENEETVFVEKYIWEQIDYSVSNGKLNTNVAGTFKQYPLKLAWAITIHKAQGQTIPNAVVDISSGAFCHGQTYVALSRIKSIEGFGLINPINRSDIIVDDAVKEFYENGCRGISLF